MNKIYYIVPDTKVYYTMPAESPEMAFIEFLNRMSPDISSYFKVVDKKPASYPHGYEYPTCKFEMAMTIIMDTLTKNNKSAYCIKGVLEDVNLSNMNAIAKLQETYDMLKESFGDWDKREAVFRRFYKMLRDMTGFSFGKTLKINPDNSVTLRRRIYVGDALCEACKWMAKESIYYDIDGKDHLLVSSVDMDKIVEMLEEKGIKAEPV